MTCAWRVKGREWEVRGGWLGREEDEGVVAVERARRGRVKARARATRWVRRNCMAVWGFGGCWGFGAGFWKA